MFGAVGYASVQARVRARRDRLLDEATWSTLRRAHGVDRALEVLRGTPYASIADGDVASFEIGSRRRQYAETRSLAASVPPAARELLLWYASRFEVQDLKVLVRALHHGGSLDEAAATLTRTADDDPRVAASTRARSPAALVGALDGTPYGRALAAAWEGYRQDGRSFYLEVALDLAYQRGLVAHIESLTGDDRRDAVDLLGRWLARANLLAAARYRALAGMSPEEVVNFCLHRDFGAGLAMVQRIAAGGSLSAEAAALGIELPTGGDDVARLLELERRSDRLRREAARARFGRSPFGVGLVLAYLIELEAEASDLTTLLEAELQGIDVADAVRRVVREVT